MSIKANIAEERWKKYVIDTSPEIINLRRQLQTAYNRYALEIQISNNKIRSLQQSTENALIADQHFHAMKSEEERMKVELEQKQKLKIKLACELQWQIMEKQCKQQQDDADAKRESSEFDHIMNAEQQEELRKAQHRQLMKVQLREEQKAFCKMQEKLKQNYDKIDKEIAKQLQEEVNRLAQRDAEVAAKRQHKIDVMEKRKNTIFAELEDLEKMQKEREEVALRLLCARKAEQEEKRREDEELSQMTKRKSLQQKYVDIIKVKEDNSAIDREIEREYAEIVQRNINAQIEREMGENIRIRSIRSAIREDNEKLIMLKTERQNNDLIKERCHEEHLKKEISKRTEMIQNERLRLLRSLDPSILHHLPRGCLEEEDLFDLNH